jgi:hypothetical protein
MNIFCIINILTSIFVCIFADVLGLLSISWGNQLYITLMETLILETIMLIFLVIEFFATRKIHLKDEYSKVAIEPNMSMLSGEESAEKELRKDALRRLIEMMKRNKGMNNQLEELMDEDRQKRRNSLPAHENSRCSTPERAYSYPVSPRTRKDLENPLINPLTFNFDNDSESFYEPPDNVYAESKPPDPIAKIGKKYSDGDTQTITEQILFNDHQLETEDARYRSGKKGRGRGRKGRLEDNIRDENESDDLGELNDLDMIKEEDDLGMSPRKERNTEEDERKKLEEDLRRKIEEEDNDLIEEEKRLASGRDNKEDKDDKEDDDIKADDDNKFIEEAEEELRRSKSIFGNFSSPNNPDDDSEDCTSEYQDSVAELVDGMFIPPVKAKRSFNENDIKGDVDRNKDGTYKTTKLPNGDDVDKMGRKVNKKGFLIDDKGNVIDSKTKKKMFKKKQLDENGDIPQPFKFERYNFNCHDIMGAYPIGKDGKPVIQETPNGQLVDESGRQVNKNGFLIDEDGNIIDKYRRRKIDKDHLTKNGSLPRMLNYDGRKFAIQDIMGELDKDPKGDLIFKKDKRGNNVDKKGRRVNDKGYLIDNEGNIIDKKENHIFDKEHLLDNEFPKVFPFSSFNADTVTGSFKRDKNGNPILKKGKSPDQFFDDNGRLVNKRGYFIDKDGNIIDVRKNLVFKKNVLRDGDLPPVFKKGLIRQDSTDSLSKLMSEIERDNDSDLDILKNQLKNFEEDKGNTSVDSLMEDTPSNYNIANQRFDEAKYKKEPEHKYNEDDEDDDDYYTNEEYESEEAEDEDDNDSITGPRGVPILNARLPSHQIIQRKGKKKRRRRRKPKLEFEDPTAADVAMARAYGGVPRGKVTRKPRRKLSGKSTTSHGSRGFSKPVKRDKFFNMGAGSTSGLGQNPKLSTLRSNDSKSNVGKTRLVSRKDKTRGPNSKVSNSDFEQIYDKNLDDFLENSDFDFESLGGQSRVKSRIGSARGGNDKLKGLESIYLQRLEANPANKKKKQVKRRGRGPGSFMGSEISDQDDLAGLIEDNYKNMKKEFAGQKTFK